MLKIANEILEPFRDSFKNKIQFRMFTAAVLGFLCSVGGVCLSSFVRCLGFDANAYDRFVHFFTRSPWSLEDAQKTWVRTVVRKADPIRISGKILLVADETNQPKSGRKIPGMRRIHQNSEDQSKPKEFFGHSFGAVGIVIGNMRKYFCVPASMRLHKGSEVLRIWDGKEKLSESARTIFETGAVVEAIGENCFEGMDRGYFTKDTFECRKEVNEWLAERGGARLDLVVRAKKNIKTFRRYTDDEKQKLFANRRGRKPEWEGKSMKELAEGVPEDGWVERKVHLYKKRRKVKIHSEVRFWGDHKEFELLVVIVKTEKRTLYLTCTDTSVDPADAAAAYAMRFSVETCFNYLKNTFHVFDYRFWSKAVDGLDKRDKTGDPQSLAKITDEKKRNKIRRAVRRIERYVFCGCVSCGIVMILVLRLSGKVDPRKICYMRTYPSMKFLSVGAMRAALSRTVLLHPDAVEDSPTAEALAAGRKKWDGSDLEFGEEGKGRSPEDSGL